MKAITIWQPYASAIAVGLKRYETRSWPTKYRGPLAIHAAKRSLSEEDYDELLLPLTRYGRNKMPAHSELAFGCVIVVAELRDCLKMNRELIGRVSDNDRIFGDWRTGRYAWRLSNPRPLVRPAPAKGLQGFWSWTE